MLPGLCGASWMVQCPHETPPRLPLLWEVSGPLGAVQEHSPGLASSPFPSWHLAQCWAPWTLPQGLSIPSAPPPPQTWCSGCLSSTQVTLAPAWPEPPPEQSVACLPRTSSAAFPGSRKTIGVFTGGGAQTGYVPGPPQPPWSWSRKPTRVCRARREGGQGRGPGQDCVRRRGSLALPGEGGTGGRDGRLLYGCGAEQPSSWAGAASP